MSLDEMVFEGKESRGMARGNVQFAIDGAQVGIDRARANNQDFSSLGIGEASCHQLQHLDLALGEAIWIGRRRALVLIRPCLRTVGARGVVGSGEALAVALRNHWLS